MIAEDITVEQSVINWWNNGLLHVVNLPLAVTKTPNTHDTAVVFHHSGKSWPDL
jgi:hypothetical protein